jgi:hypothetical protein
MPRFTIAAALVLAALVGTLGEANAVEPHDREGWVLGLAYGQARGEAEFAGDRSANTEDGVSPQVRLGYMLNRHFSLGASYVGWLYETGTVPTKLRLSMQNIMLAGTWYPGRGDSPLAGLYVRVGAGLAWSSIAEVELVEGEEQGHGERETDTGLGLELNLGYEFRVVHNTAVGVGFGINHQIIDGTLYETSTYFPVTLNLGWYWN